MESDKVHKMSINLLVTQNHYYKGSFQKRFSGFCPLRGGGLPSGTQEGAKRWWSSARDSGSDVTTTAYKGRGALSTETVVPKPQSDHRRHIATDGRRRQVLVRLEMLHHYHSDHPDSHTPARYPPLGLIQIRPNACTVILKLILFQNIVEPTRI